MCEKCSDTGYIIVGDIAKRCECRREEDLLVRKKRMGLTPLLMKMNYANFDLSFYSSEKMTKGGITYEYAVKKILYDSKIFVLDVVKKCDTSGLFIHGDVGCGKTYIAAAIANELAERGIELKFVVVPDFLDELRNTYRGETDVTEQELMEQIKNVPVLFLDDLGSHNYTDWSVNILYSIINYRVNYELPIVVTSNNSIQELEDLIGSRICSRLLEACNLYYLYCDTDIRTKKRRKK